METIMSEISMEKEKKNVVPVVVFVDVVVDVVLFIVVEVVAFEDHLS